MARRTVESVRCETTVLGGTPPRDEDDRPYGTRAGALFVRGGRCGHETSSGSGLKEKARRRWRALGASKRMLLAPVATLGSLLFVAL